MLLVRFSVKVNIFHWRKSINNKSTLCLKKSSHLYTLCNFVKSQPMFTLFALLESVWNLLQNPYSITHLTLGMSLHNLEKLKMQISGRL